MMLRNLVMSSLDAPDAVDRFEVRMFDLATAQDVEVKAEDIAGLEDLGEQYVRETLRLLESCVAAADQAHAKDLFKPIVSACERFFLQPDPRIPDHGGLFGLICNCYCARELLAILSEKSRSVRGFPLLATDPHGEARIIRSLLGRKQTGQLDAIVEEVFQSPSIRFSLNGAYSLTGSLRASGRTSEWETRWEDLMTAYGEEIGLRFTGAA